MRINTTPTLRPYLGSYKSSLLLDPELSDRLDLEMQRDQAKHQGLEILDQVIENSQPVGVCRVRHVVDRTDFSRLSPGSVMKRLGGCRGAPSPTHLERDVIVSKLDLQFLLPVLVLCRPFRVVFPVPGVSSTRCLMAASCGRRTS